MLATLLRPDAGRASVLGRDIVADSHGVRSLVSLTGQMASVDEDLTGRENLMLLGRLLRYRRDRARQRADELIDAFGLADASAGSSNTTPAACGAGSTSRRASW